MPYSSKYHDRTVETRKIIFLSILITSILINLLKILLCVEPTFGSAFGALLYKGLIRLIFLSLKKNTNFALQSATTTVYIPRVIMSYLCESNRKIFWSFRIRNTSFCVWWKKIIPFKMRYNKFVFIV